jgi:phosphatidylinositol kinase/protein kinase (PI-3  family)
MQEIEKINIFTIEHAEEKKQIIFDLSNDLKENIKLNLEQCNFNYKKVCIDSIKGSLFTISTRIGFEYVPHINLKYFGFPLCTIIGSGISGLISYKNENQNYLIKKNNIIENCILDFEIKAKAELKLFIKELFILMFEINNTNNENNIIKFKNFIKMNLYRFILFFHNCICNSTILNKESYNIKNISEIFLTLANNNITNIIDQYCQGFQPFFKNNNIPNCLTFNTKLRDEIFNEINKLYRDNYKNIFIE